MPRPLRPLLKECENCGKFPVVWSHPDDYQPIPRFAGLTERQLKHIDLGFCRGGCGLGYVFTKKRGKFIHHYHATYRPWVYERFQENPNFNESDAGSLYDEIGYGETIPRWRYVEDLMFYKNAWDVKQQMKREALEAEMRERGYDEPLFGEW